MTTVSYLLTVLAGVALAATVWRVVYRRWPWQPATLEVRLVGVDKMTPVLRRLETELRDRALEEISAGAREAFRQTTHRDVSRRWDEAARRHHAINPPSICYYCQLPILPSAFVNVERTNVFSGAVETYPAHEGCEVEYRMSQPDDWDVDEEDHRVH